MAKIRITAIGDQVELPEWLKKELTGLVFPVSEVPESQMPLHVCSVHGAHKKPITACASDYFVKLSVFLQILRYKSYAAAKWFEENFEEKTVMGSVNGWIGFAKEECDVIA